MTQTMTMDKVFDAVFRADARELVAQGRFIAEKFGSTGQGGTLRIDPEHAPVPEPDDPTGQVTALSPPDALTPPERHA